MEKRIKELIEESREDGYEVKKINIEGEYVSKDVDFPIRDCYIAYGFCGIGKRESCSYFIESFLYEKNADKKDEVYLFEETSAAALNFVSKIAYEVSVGYVC